MLSFRRFWPKRSLRGLRIPHAATNDRVSSYIIGYKQGIRPDSAGWGCARTKCETA